uniref:E3 ubiquitin-protein ligase RMA n=1 Tax=Davidia involucrata TaxID=16924 RepID=A0A5B6ZIM1_DAVIN
MGDETPNTMNLDLNLGPLVPHSTYNELGSGSLPNETVNLEDWIDGSVHRIREAVGRNTRQRWRSLWRQVPIPPETRNIALELMVDGGDGRLQTGEGSVAAEERDNEMMKTCDNNTTLAEDEALGKKEDVEKGSGNEGSFFDCNICLDLARDPVVTCCGHMFCWPCLYRWLHVHSDTKECPVCKGEVTNKNVIPIYGRGNNNRELEEDSSLKIPLRPRAWRIESWRQTIQRTALPMEEMIRRLGSRFDLTRDLLQVQPQNTHSTRNLAERSNYLLNRIPTSRGMRRERNTVPPDDVVDLTQSSPTNSEVGESRWLSSLLRRRSHRAATISNLTSALSNAERIVESYFHNHPVETNQEQPPPVDDTDSMSSIAAVIHSESQTVDTAVEIDSTVLLSTSSSRRRNDASKILIFPTAL